MLHKNTTLFFATNCNNFHRNSLKINTLKMSLSVAKQVFCCDLMQKYRQRVMPLPCVWFFANTAYPSTFAYS